MDEYNIPVLGIGLPVYNGKQFIQKKIESILNQTFTDFEIFITDNCSTDGTGKICDEFAKKDQRIHVIHHEKNIGAKRNFYSSIKISKNEFFVWTAVDDLMDSTFLEKNIKQLKLNENIVGSISKIEYYSLKNKKDFKFIQLNSVLGTYEEKIRFFLTNSSANLIYSVFKKKYLEKSLIKEPIGTWDSAIVLNVLRYGDINVLDEVLLKFFEEGISSMNLYKRVTHVDSDMGNFSSSDSYFFKWCIKYLGLKIVLKNFDVFFWLNFSTLKTLVFDFLNRN
jgi:glycosyltransferase involved in cell wall biosynthesis